MKMLSSFLFLMIGATVAQAASTLPLVRSGHSDYIIALAPDASPSQHRGAAELQNWLGQISGAKLPITTDSGSLPAHAIIVGDARAAQSLGIAPDPSLGPEGFIIRTVGQRLVIAGSPVRGTMYGCTDLLERLGVRWFTPTVTRVPHMTDITLGDLNIRQTPAFEYREPYFAEAFDKDWAARNRCNGSSEHLDKSTGGKIAYADFCHTLDRLVPRDLYKTHPEYFPLIDGKRKDGYVQRCLTNPDVLRITIQNVTKIFKEHPDAVITSVSQDDCNDWCQCPKCTAMAAKYGGQSGLYLWFVNQVAKAVEKDYPNKLIGTLAYQFTEAPPKNIKPRHNVRVRLCPINCCLAHPFETDTQRSTRTFLKHLKGWAAITDTLYIWHYNTDFGHYLMPFPDFAEFPADIRLYRKSGVKGIYFEGDYAGWGGGSDAELRSYVMAKLLWNPDQDANALVNDYLNGVFGPAAPRMRAYFDLMQSTVKDPTHHLHCYDAPKASIFTEDFLSRANALFDQAEKLPLNDQQRLYLKKERLGISYLDLYFHPRTGKIFDDFVADLHSLRITNISESTSVDAWAKQYRAEHQQRNTKKGNINARG